MLVCHCEGVTEREVRRAVTAGACTQEEIARRCGAGRQCGGCRPVIDEILDDELQLDRPPGNYEPLLSQVA